jgi:predicted nucleotidyltransferase
MDTSRINHILTLVKSFAAEHPEILALGLCGSWARGTPGPGSDIDLSIIVQNKTQFREISWLEKIAFGKIGDPLDHYEDHDYGRVWSRHVFLISGTEIEFSFADRSWVETNPVDPGTAQVVRDGYKILYDPNKLLHQLLDNVNVTQ